jgi:putative N-acetyltransferase (TIGR04045 family)
MLDGIHPWGQAVRPYVSAAFRTSVAAEAWQLSAYFRLRREIFGEEQGLFADSDVDERDARAIPIVAMSEALGMPDEVIGVVRIYEDKPGLWFGGRLGVCHRYRRRGAVGAALIERAVRTAHTLGARQFLATVQLANVRYFERYHFRSLEPVDVCGKPHQLMEADLHSYPPEPHSFRQPTWRAA